MTIVANIVAFFYGGVIEKKKVTVVATVVAFVCGGVATTKATATCCRHLLCV